MGYRRAGFYTYALLDNAGYESADRILPEYQDPKAGDRMPMSRKVNETTAFKVKAFERNQWLVWESRIVRGRGSSSRWTGTGLA